MRNMGFLTLIGLATLLVSCGPGIPEKEMESAKTALERARSVEAPVFAADDYQSADQDYQNAQRLIQEKKNKEAQERALASATKAERSFGVARERRAVDIYEKCSNQMQIAEANFAPRIKPDTYPGLKTQFDGLASLYAVPDYDGTYTNGTNLYPPLKEMADFCLSEVDSARNAIASAQDKYDAAEVKEIVRTYVAEELASIRVLLDKARAAFNEGNMSDAREKARQAEEAILAVEKKAADLYQAQLNSQRTNQGQLDLQGQQDKESQKQKAQDIIDEARKKLQQLRGRPQSIQLPIEINQFAYVIPEYNYVAGVSDTNAPAALSNVSETYTDEMVDQYLKLAEQAYANEEFLDAIDYGREAIRIADILIAQKTESVYVVKLNPENRDCLWKIAGYVYQNKTWLWPVIWRANKFQIQDPDLIYPGQKLKVPPALLE